MHKNWQSMAIFNSDLLHGAVHHPTKFQADSPNPYRARVVMLFETDRQADKLNDDHALQALMAAEGKNLECFLPSLSLKS